MPNNLGTEGKSVFLKEIENHKLHQEFEVNVGQSIKRGQPVVLAGSAELVNPAGTAEANINIIGYAVHNGEAGELVTVGMRAYAIIWAEAKSAMVPGPVKYDSYNGTTEKNVSEDGAVAADHTGWVLDDAAAPGDEVRVALF